MFWMRLLTSALGFVLWAFQPAYGDRLALVIGNDAYKGVAEGGLPALEKAVTDARQMSAALTRLGFKVETVENATLSVFISKVAAFRDSVEPDDEVVVFFAGHGVAINERNYLLPVDLIRPEQGPGEEESVIASARDAADLVQSIQAKGPRYVFAIFDACRNNPFASAGRRSIGETRGLKRMEAEADMLLFFSAGPGQEALDKLPGDGPEVASVFTRTLLKYLEKPGLTALDIIGFTKRDVKQLAQEKRKHKQFPDYSDRTVDPIVFKPVDPASSEDLNAKRTKEEFAEREDRDAYIDATTVGTIEAFETYMARPNARWMRQAQANLTRLRGLKPSQPSQPPGCDGEILLVGLKALEKSDCIKPGSGRSFQDCGECPEMVLVPAGSFPMGSPKYEPGHESDEEPQHEVVVSKPFAVGKFEITFDEWDACAAAGGCGNYKPADQGWGRGRRPVINVSWDDAKLYVDWLSRKTGKQYRLLSESEWEYVARAGTQTPFWWGDKITSKQANYDGTVVYNNGVKSEWLRKTVEVNAFSANAWGLYNVHGNVYEWVEDCYNNSYTSKLNINKNDSTPLLTQGCAARVRRGGSWINNPVVLRAAFRNGNSPDNRYDYVGLRVARMLLPL